MKLKINEVFKSLQGEGEFAGYPVFFIRLSGCNRSCTFCDTAYHNEINLELTPEELAERIIDSEREIVVWTGGEPMLQKDGMIETIKLVQEKKEISHQLETNSIILDSNIFEFFDYIAFSPKTLHYTRELVLMLQLYPPWEYDYDIKIVTDIFNLNKNLLRYATCLMPLTTYDEKKDLEISRNVWTYCSQNNILYCPRLHVDVWGNKKGV